MLLHLTQIVVPGPTAHRWEDALVIEAIALLSCRRREIAAIQSYVRISAIVRPRMVSACRLRQPTAKHLGAVYMMDSADSSIYRAK